eukprot:scaffold6994_cov145-Skeletonema_dohrnii-CCMP3373.AAC.10
MEADDNPARIQKQSTRDRLLREIVQLKQSYGENVEHYHQIGHGYDMHWINQRNEEERRQFVQTVSSLFLIRKL